MHERAVKLVNDMDRRRAEQIEKLKEGKSKMAANNREPKITREQLLDECKKHGTSFDAAKIIAPKYGMSWRTIYGVLLWLKENPDATVETIAAAFGVDPEEVRRKLNELGVEV